VSADDAHPKARHAAGRGEFNQPRHPTPGTQHQATIAEGASGSANRQSHGDLHDLVDDLMEQAILHGGQLALVCDGDLDEHDRIALIGRRRN